MKESILFKQQHPQLGSALGWYSKSNIKNSTVFKKSNLVEKLLLDQAMLSPKQLQGKPVKYRVGGAEGLYSVVSYS